MAPCWRFPRLLAGALALLASPCSSLPAVAAERRPTRAASAAFGAALPLEEEGPQEALLGFGAESGRRGRHEPGRPEEAPPGGGSADASDDPLVRFLSSLSFRIPDASTSSHRLSSLNITDIVCTGVAITALDTAVQGSNESGSVGLALRVRGISGRCAGSYAASGLAGLIGKGNFTADLPGGANSSAALEFTLPLDSGRIPTKVEATACSAHLKVQVALAGSARWIDWLVPRVSKFVESQVVKLGCLKLKEVARTDLTYKLGQLNDLMPPPVKGGQRASPELAADVQADALPTAATAESIDWTKQQALAWGNWFLGEFVGPAGVNKALRWALKNASAVTIPGPEGPLVRQVMNQTEKMGISLEVDVGLKEVTLEGVESLRELAPFTAAAPDQLQGKIGFGTKEQPAIGFRATALLSVKATDPRGRATAQTVQEELSLHLGLSKPSLAGRLELLCDAARWGESRKAGQWYFGAAGCLKSLLLQAPAVQSLDVNFAGLAAPLTFTFNTQGQLEGDIAEAVNNGIRLFNMVYERFLPGAIARFVGSPRGLTAINAALGSALAPGTCISAEAAEAQARKLPRYFSDWSRLLSGKLRDLVDNAVDGFIAQNNSEYSHERSAIPPVNLGPVHQLRLKELAALGTDQISKLRVLQPGGEGEKALSMEVDVACPAEGRAYKPSLLVGGEAAVGPLAVAGNATAEAPCGSLSATADVAIDFWELMRMPLPPTVACTALQPFSELAVTRLAGAWRGGGRLLLQPQTGGAARDPAAELCRMHPDACKLVEQLGGYVLTPAHLTELLRELRDAVLAGCESEASTSAPGAWKTDSLGFSYVDPETAGLWVVAIGASLALGVVGTTVVSRFARTAMRASLAAECWRRWPVAGPILSSAISLALAGCLVFRVLACFFLPYASASAGALLPSSGTELADVKLVMFAYLGTMKQFWLGGSAYCAIVWIIATLVASLLSLLAFVAVWFAPLGGARRVALLRLALFAGRLPFAELETLGNTGLALFQDIDMPLDLQLRLRLNVEVGQQVGLVTTTVTLLAGLALLALTELDGAAGPRQPATKRKAFLLSACGSVLLGLVVFAAADFVRFDVGGGAGAFIAPSSLAGRHLTRAGTTLASFLVVTCLLAPVLQVSGVVLGFVPRLRGRTWLRAVVEVGMAFNCIDIFWQGYILTFLEGITSFLESTVHAKFRPLCELLQKAASEDCIMIWASVAPLGLLGLSLAGLGTLFLTGLHIKDSLRKSRGAESAETFLDCQDETASAGRLARAGASEGFVSYVNEGSG